MAKDWKEDYETCELENKNLRDALAWAAKHLTDEQRNVLERCLDAPLEEGGVTGTSAEDERQDLVELICKLITHLEPLLLTPPASSTKQSFWFARLDFLLTKARQYEPKHPLMQRIGGHPNVFAPVKKLD